MRGTKAGTLTTEFTMLINAKYPPEKGLTREEYDSVMDEDDRKWQEMIDKQGGWFRVKTKNPTR